MKRNTWTDAEDKQLTKLLQHNPTNPDWSDLHTQMTAAGFKKTLKQLKNR